MKTVTLAMLGIALATPALAQGPGSMGEIVARMPLMKALNPDGDTQISAKEIAGASEALRRLDKNGDGTLTHDEIRPAKDAAAIVERLMRLDANGDGALTQDEVPPPVAANIGAADSDGDGKITQEELGAHLANSGSGDSPMARRIAGSPLLRALDADGDRVISAKEIAGASAALKRLDRNGDGRLTRDEIAPMGRPGGGRP